MVYHNFFYQHDPSPEYVRNNGLAGLSGFLADNPKTLLSYDLFPTATLAFRRTILQRLVPIPEALVVQADAHLSACVIFVAPIVYVDQALTVYRVHAGNLWNWGGNTPTGCDVFHGDPAAKARLQRRVIV